MADSRYDVFISYRRSEAGAAARLLQRCLQDEGFSVFLDVDELGSGHFDDSLLRTIEEAQNFLVVLSKDCFDRCEDPDDWFRREIVTALRNSRNIIPVMMPGFAYPDAGRMPADLREVVRHQCVTYSQEYFDAMIKKLLGFLKSPGRPPMPSQPPSTAGTDARTNSLGNELVRIPVESPSTQERQTLYASRTCVANRDYVEFVRAGGSPPRVHPKYPNERTWEGRRCPTSMLDHPVVCLTQADARNFCVWLTQKERAAGMLGGNESYTLPTFTQWKALALGARLTNRTVVGRQWNPGQYQPTAPVTWDTPSSGLGCYHVYGNVFEWCLDERNKSIRRSGKPVNVPFYLSVGGGWASDRDWLQQAIQQGSPGAIWCPYGWLMRDGGFRVWLMVANCSRKSLP